MLKFLNMLGLILGPVILTVLFSSTVQAAFPRDQIIKQQLDMIEAVPLEQTRQLAAVQQPLTQEPAPVEPPAIADSQNTVEQQPILPASAVKEEPVQSKDVMLQKSIKPMTRRTHTFDMGADVYYNRYNEHDVDVFLLGTMVGYYGNYTYRPPQGSLLNNDIFNMYRFEGHYAEGRLNYKGSGKDKGQTNKMYELRGLAGKDYLLSDGSRVTPYFGFGYRFLFDHGDGRFTSDGHIGYDRQSNYFYIPVGVTVDIPVPRDREISFNLEYDFFLQGVQKSELSDIQPFTSGLTQDARNHQDKGFGIRASMRFLKHYSPFDVYVEPFVRYWNIENSKTIDLVIEDTAASGIEPHNTTTEVGSKFGVQF